MRLNAAAMRETRRKPALVGQVKAVQEPLIDLGQEGAPGVRDPVADAR
jgi:hypothetical protein